MKAVHGARKKRAEERTKAHYAFFEQHDSIQVEIVAGLSIAVCISLGISKRIGNVECTV